MNMPDFYRTLICDINMTEEECQQALSDDAYIAACELCSPNSCDFESELEHQQELRGVA